MRTISITIDEPLLEAPGSRGEGASSRTRSELFRLALQEWLDGQRRRQLVARDRAGYEAHPVRADEFEGLIAAQAVAMRERPDPDDGDDW